MCNKTRKLLVSKCSLHKKSEKAPINKLKLTRRALEVGNVLLVPIEGIHVFKKLQALVKSSDLLINFYFIINIFLIAFLDNFIISCLLKAFGVLFNKRD